MLIKEGANNLRRMLADLGQGKTAAELGLLYRPSVGPEIIERVWDSFNSSYPSYDLEAIRQLQGHDAEWIRAQLAFNLGQRDVRAAKAVAALDWKDMLPVMEEAVDEMRHLRKIRPVLEAAVAQLSGI